LPGGELDADAQALTLFSAWDHDALQWQAALAVSSGDYDTERKVTLGSATRSVKGSTDGVQIGAEVGADYRFETHTLEHGPRLRLAYQIQSVSGFSESTAAGSSTAMKFGSQSNRFSSANLGWTVRMTQGSWQPYAAVEWERRFGGDADAVSAALVNLPNNSFTLPAAAEDDSYGEVTLGMVTRLSDSTRLDARASRLVANDDSEELRLNLSLNIGF
ncbi:MAG TPA: autotransporter outer membrane beta-barrel domain-containing protein, partial [Motiliproteus sp.]